MWFEVERYNFDLVDMFPLLAVNTWGIRIVVVDIPESSIEPQFITPTQRHDPHIVAIF